MKPYKESKNGNIIRRTFSHDVSESELVWHRDREDRIVLPLNENDWMVQFDNQLPTKLMVGEEYFIPKNAYHRVIKGDGDLMVEIIETNFNDDAYEIYEVIEEGKKKKKKKKKDACYHKVRSRYDVWPSAYASGALVKCRKVGAANWGNSSNESVNEVITSEEPKAEVDTFLTRSLNTLSRFIYGKDVTDFMNKLKNIATFDNFTLKLSKGGDGANQFIIEILDENNKVGKFVAFIYKDKETGNQNLQIQKVEIYPEYKGKGIMRNFYQEFNEWLKNNLNNFDRFTSDFIFLYNKETGKYDGFNMWEDLVKKGLAKRLGPDSDYIPPTTPPKNGMWSINSGYVLNEVIEEKWSSDYKKSIDCNNPKGFSQKAHCDARKKRQRGEETKSKPINENVGEISRIVNQYMKDSEYDIQNSLGNCSFFTRDMLNWAKKNGIKADYVFMPMSEEYRKENNISDSEWEDHIVPMINGIIIDFVYTPQGVSKNIRTKNTIPPRIFKYSDNLFKPNGIYGKFGYIKPEINTEYDNPKNINSFDVVEPNKKKEDLGELKIYESIDKIAGVWDTNEKFEDGSDFKIKFKVSDVIELAKNLPVENIDPKKINYDFSGRQEDPTKTKDRVNKADLSYPIIVAKNENGKIFAMLDGTHRLEKALSLGLDSIKVKILNKEDLVQFKTDSLDEAKKTDFSKEKSKGLHGWFERQGGKGKSKGWVDCNTCRKDPETGRKKCKTCGRKDGEERAKYPACRPTPSACGTRGKGKKWGKKTSNENLNMLENFSIFDKNYLKMKLNETFNYEEPLVLPSEPVTKPKESPMVQPSRRNKPFLPERESQPDPKAEK